MIEIIRQLQLPVLSLILLTAAGAKLSRVVRTGSLSAGLGPTELFPVRLRRPAAFLVCVIEAGLGVALIATAGGHSSLVRSAATGTRLGAALFFLVSMCALVEVRDRRPDVGCGCFGTLSTRPTGYRSIIRAGLLAGAALVTIGAGPARLPPPSLRAAADLGLLVAELLLLAAISPEVGEALVRLGYTEPCELRRIPAERVLASLRRSSHWRRYAGEIGSDRPADMWRELCWWYVVYPGGPAGAESDIVFAVQVKKHRPGVQSAVVPRQPVPGGQPAPAQVPGQREAASPVAGGSSSVPSGQI
ncbi:MAG: methylamine utilization protein MauD [Actinobacteria bacterium]|nr:methylamine utilization protein MauD [Actinomycetota bacterium]MBO0788881.1 methylamine utilization protein MauD [Actinomycetota bacterium]